MGEMPLTIEEAAGWLRSGKITSQELTAALLARAHAYQDTVGAFITLMDESALAEAKAADTNFAAGIDKGPLQGIPIGVKDIIATIDAPSTANSNVLDPAWGNREDATVVKKLRQAGAVIVGKLSLNEFAIGWPDPTTGFRVPRNPWNVAHSPGGSSSGTGIAVALGLILGGLGTDTGGSIRFPAAFCGISGIKQTFGLVSKEGCVPLGYSLDHIGPMARSVYDCAVMLQVLAGYDPLDPCSLNVAVPEMLAGLDGSVEGLTIGLPIPYFFDNPALDPEVKAGVLGAVDLLKEAGAKVVEVALSYAEEGSIAQRVTMFSEAFAYHEGDLQTKPEIYGRYTRRSIREAALYTGADYVQAQRVRSVIKQKLAGVMQGVDVLVMPTAASPAPSFADFETNSTKDVPSFCGLFNLTGSPAMSIPVGFSSRGLPLSMQIVGKPLAESTVFKVGHAYQQRTNWHLKVPELTVEGVSA